MSDKHVIVIGAGVGGLAAAADLARAGLRVTVYERAAGPGGKMRQVDVDGVGVDAGPTVFTMRWVFDDLFASAGSALDKSVQLHAADILARHAWTSGGTLDLFAGVEASRDAIAAFSSAHDAQGYIDFCRRSAEMYEILRDTFINAPRPGPFSLAQRIGYHRPRALWRTAPYLSMWRALGAHFRDPRLRQLFARYTTYVGSSPLQAPATLMLIAHVEQSGVWFIEGGMRALATALQALGERQGARYQYDRGVREILVEKGAVCGVVLEDGERVSAGHIVFNGDVSALGAGLLGAGLRSAAPAARPAQRGLSAVTWCVRGRATGFPLHYHNVFFDRDYPAEFRTLFRGRDIVERPTVYLCAQDRLTGRDPGGPERLLLLVNAPATGDTRDWSPAQLVSLRERALGVLADCGVQLAFEETACKVTAPTDFDRLFPGSGGSLYGRASHGMLSSFQRPGSRSRNRGLYLAGGSVHPGPGVPMATLSGRLAARALLADLGAGS